MNVEHNKYIHRFKNLVIIINNIGPFYLFGLYYLTIEIDSFVLDCCIYLHIHLSWIRLGSLPPEMLAPGEGNFFEVGAGDEGFVHPVLNGEEPLLHLCG